MPEHKRNAFSESKNYSEEKSSRESKVASPKRGKGLRSIHKSMSPRRKDTLIRRLTHKLLVDRGQHCFEDWFTPEQIDLFHDNPDITLLNPLFKKYKGRMEEALKDFGHDEGLHNTNEIMDAIQQDVESSRVEHRKLMKMIDTMSNMEDFFIMMQKKADRKAKRIENSEQFDTK